MQATMSLGARFAGGRAVVVWCVPGWPPGITCRKMESKDPYFSKLEMRMVSNCGGTCRGVLFKGARLVRGKAADTANLSDGMGESTYKIGMCTIWQQSQPIEEACQHAVPLYP